MIVGTEVSRDTINFAILLVIGANIARFLYQAAKSINHNTPNILHIYIHQISGFVYERVFLLSGLLIRLGKWGAIVLVKILS